MSIGVHSKYGRSVTREDLFQAEEGEKEHLLDDDSDADEDATVFSHNNSARGEVHTDGKITKVRIQIKEVTDVMRENVKKVVERGERLEDLQEASDRLTIAGSEFREAAKKAQRAAWMQNVRSRIIVIAVIAILILCIIVPIIYRLS